jgi:hypothetical protein
LYDDLKNAGDKLLKGNGIKKMAILVSGAFLFSVFLFFSVSSVALAGPYGIHVVSATYGGNCGAKSGNVTNHIARECNGRSNCRYTGDHKIIGDPAYGCSKNYVIRYRCGNSGSVYEKSLSAEAGWGDKSVVLDCSR